MSDWCQVLGEKRRVRQPREGVHSQVHKYSAWTVRIMAEEVY